MIYCSRRSCNVAFYFYCMLYCDLKQVCIIRYQLRSVLGPWASRGSRLRPLALVVSCASPELSRRPSDAAGRGQRKRQWLFQDAGKAQGDESSVDGSVRLLEGCTIGSRKDLFQACSVILNLPCSSFFFSPESRASKLCHRGQKNYLYFVCYTFSIILTKPCSNY